MAAINKKSVHWGANDSISDTGEPSFSSTVSDTTSGTFEYLNAQLVAHGFAPSPGLSLDGLSNPAAERVVKCLLDLLGQRTNDMARTEDLSAKLRVLHYDYERMKSMHHTAQQQAENCEREVNLHKTRLASANKTLQAAEASHKRTSTELQRTKHSLQSVRNAHETELKKKEREIERILERWSKIADVQAKLSHMPCGLTPANAEAADNTGVLGKGQNLLELALEQAEQARGQLSTENLRLKKLVLRTINQLYALMYKVQHPDSEDEPNPFDLDSIFPLNPPDAAEHQVTSIITTFEDALTRVLQGEAGPGIVVDFNLPVPPIVDHAPEVSRLRRVIDSLTDELDRVQADSAAQIQEAQSLFDEFVQKHAKFTEEDTAKAASDAHERERLRQLELQLENEQERLSEEVIRLKKEKATFELERKSWEAQKMVADHSKVSPVKPMTVVSEHANTQLKPSAKKVNSRKKPPGKSPVKVFKVGKSSRRTATTASRVVRESSATSSTKVIPAYETEVIPVPILPTTRPHKSSGSSRENLNLSKLPTLLTTSFVLPPPSPQASLPRHPVNLSQPVPPPQFLPSLTSTLPGLPDFVSPDMTNALPSYTPFDSSPLIDEMDPSSSAPINNPSTHDVHQPFPVAKPLAQRMVHAYSPVKPSPLSRVLVATHWSDMSQDSDLEKSPSERQKETLEAVVEEGDQPMLLGDTERFPPVVQEQEEMSLAQQLGIPDSPPDPSQLKRKRVDSSGSTEGSKYRRKRKSLVNNQSQGKKTARGRVLIDDAYPSSAVRKHGQASGSADNARSNNVTGRNATRRSARVASIVAVASKAVEDEQTEKENKRHGTVQSANVGSSKAAVASSRKASEKRGRGTASVAPTSKETQSHSEGTKLSARARLIAKLPPSSRLGPRRIPANSPDEGS
ncbi:hypothetical protein AMATHDRAFT_4112 [Amanita thiersii Skay4041]|uniref:Afadin and alpha-actinin-binding-domain-containing protein n=1 Tax=Amanita thiersii Skay4041 TaxID=703135 RepID=A0A2A9NLU5_9AGAR|nr:hypothetical protein AMATHDRAFT_4112 [Amanita thiersii Skay4041]